MRRFPAIVFFLAASAAITGRFSPFLRADEPTDYLRKEPTAHDRIYTFEHGILPGWVHKSNGAFYDDLAQGQTGQLVKAGAQVVGDDFAAGIKVRKIDDPAGFLITFPQPKDMTECYFAAVLKNGEQYRYVTLELTEDLLNDGTKTCLCEWSPEGDHLNFGPRKFADEANFIAELKERAGDKSPPAPAAVTSPAGP
ncbi:MAG TPA: hypothetical protein VFB27_04135 [Opitutaceae bacterium]|nr:hypothetical protein [Opitutaceae bacterium]